MSYLSSNLYETVYVLKSSVSEGDATAVHGKVDNVIKKFKGEVRDRDDLGVREMAYQIRKEKTGRYVIVHYSGNAGVVEEIERHFKINGDILRYMTVMIDEDYDYKKFKKQMTEAEEERKKAREFREQKRKERRD